MSEQASIESILPDDNAQTQPATAEPVVDRGAGDKPDAAAPPAAAPQTVPDGFAPLAVVQDERRKRQELERRMQEYERMLQAQAQPRPQQPPPPDWYAEPDQAARQLQHQFGMQIYETRVQLSQQLMRGQKPDYDEMEKIFAEDAQRNPGLWQEIMRHPLPAQYAYDYGRKQKVLREIGDDPDSYRKRIIDEFLAQNGGQAPPAAQLPAPSQAKPKAPVPRSLAAVPSNQPRDERGRWQGPASLEQIFGD